MLADISPEAASFYKALGDTKVTGELHTTIGDMYTSYLDIPENIISREEFKGLETAYRNFEANSTVANAAAFLDEGGRVYVRYNMHNTASPMRRREPRVCRVSEGFKNSPIDWDGNSAYIQKEDIKRDLGVYDSPDVLFTQYAQKIGRVKKWFYIHITRHAMNRQVSRIRG